MPNEYLKSLLRKLDEGMLLSELEFDYVLQHLRLTEKAQEILRRPAS